MNSNRLLDDVVSARRYFFECCKREKIEIPNDITWIFSHKCFEEILNDTRVSPNNLIRGNKTFYGWKYRIASYATPNHLFAVDKDGMVLISLNIKLSDLEEQIKAKNKWIAQLLEQVDMLKKQMLKNETAAQLASVGPKMDNIVVFEKIRVMNEKMEDLDEL